MSAVSNRLAATTADGLGGDWIDRSRPISFRLNGMMIEGFAGDTVLSAAIAAGLSSAGTRGGLPLALTPRFAPLVRPAGVAEGEFALLPMQRTPITEGAEYVTPGFRASSRFRQTAARLFEQVVNSHPPFPPGPLLLAVTYVELGRLDDAECEIEALKTVSDELTLPFDQDTPTFTAPAPNARTNAPTSQTGR